MSRQFGLLIAAGTLVYVGLNADPAHSSARVLIKENISYYDVSGSTGREIFKSMLDNGPKLGKRNEHALATTQYSYDVKNVNVELRNGRCVPKSLEVVMSVEYTYPRWRVSRNAGRETRNAWKQFKKSVIWHEKQHVKIATEYANAYAKALKKTRLKSDDNCTSGSFATAWRASLAALKHNRKQRQFDKRDLRPGGRGYEAQLNLIQAQ